MGYKEAGTALAEATKVVLETMCFVAAEEVPCSAPVIDPLIAAQVEFRGYWTGRCMVEMPESCARVIAGNFVGIADSSQVDASMMIELLCEFANMVCGSTISRLQCPGLVTLAPPHLIWEWPSTAEPRVDPAFERWMDTGEGVVRVGFETWTAS